MVHRDRRGRRLASASRLTWLWLAASGVLVAAAQAGPAGGDEAELRRIAERVASWSGSGGSGIPYLTFSLVEERKGSIVAQRRHFWNVSAEMHRIEMKDAKGDSVVCLTHLPTKIGACAINEVAVIEEAAAPYVEKAYEAWSEDMAWLLLPTMVNDPEVTLKHEGDDRQDGTIYDKLSIRPGGRWSGVAVRGGFLAWVDRETGRIDRCRHLGTDAGSAEDARAGEIWILSGWRKLGNLRLAAERTSPDGGSRRLYRDLEVLSWVDGRVFSTTLPVEPSWLRPASRSSPGRSARPTASAP